MKISKAPLHIIGQEHW